MDPRTAPLADIVRLHTRLFVNCFADVDDATALARPATAGDRPAANSMAFIGAHLVDARDNFLTLLGGAAEKPFPELDDGEAIDDFDRLPTVAALIAAWKPLGEALASRLESITADELAAAQPFEFGMADKTLVGAASFLVHHEAYHVGQLSLLRREHGLEAMGYG